MLSGIRSDLTIKPIEEMPQEKGVSLEVKALESPKPSNPFEAISRDMRTDARKWATRVAATAAADKTLEKFLQLPPLKPVDEALGRVTGRVYSALTKHTTGALRYADLLGWKEVSFTPQELRVAKINPFSPKFLTTALNANLGGFQTAKRMRQEVNTVQGFKRIVIMDNLKKTIEPLETKGLFTFSGRAFVAGAALLKVLGESTQYYKQQQDLENQGKQSRGSTVFKTFENFVLKSGLGIATWEAANIGVQLAKSLLIVVPRSPFLKKESLTLFGIILGSIFASGVEVGLNKVVK
jgi:hypothetical protein